MFPQSLQTTTLTGILRYVDDIFVLFDKQELDKLFYYSLLTV